MKIATKMKNTQTLLDNDKNIYCLNRDVHLFSQDGTAQILDFQRGQFYGLDAIATQMLSLVLEKGFLEAVSEITTLYEAPEEQIRSDLTQLLNQLSQKKLLVTSSTAEDAKYNERLNNIFVGLLKKTSSILRKSLNPQPDPNHNTVELLLSLSWISFRLLGWSRTIALWQNWHRSAIADSSTAIIQNIDQLVREGAANKLFFPVVCKERALVGYHLLRTFYGFPTNLVIGIDRYPFQIHAWVECNGLVITDDAAHCEMFTPVIKYS